MSGRAGFVHGDCVPCIEIGAFCHDCGCCAHCTDPCAKCALHGASKAAVCRNGDCCCEGDR